MAGHHYTLYLFSICLGSWRSQCWFGDFDNFISLSCVYLAFPIWLYGYDFREFQPFRVLKHKENCNIKSAELALPPLHSPCLRRAPNLLYLNIRFLDVWLRTFQWEICFMKENDEQKWPMKVGPGLGPRWVWLRGRRGPRTDTHRGTCGLGEWRGVSRLWALLSEPEIPRTPPNWFLFLSDFDLMIGTTWDWIWNHRIIKYIGCGWTLRNQFLWH